MTLSKVTSFQAPDLTPEERKVDNILLKERWLLIQLGFDKKNNSEFCVPNTILYLI